MSPRTLALYLLRALASAQIREIRPSLDELTQALGVRRVDVRTTLGRLHREGLVDVTRMRVTLAGFALGTALAHAELPALRKARRAAGAAA